MPEIKVRDWRAMKRLFQGRHPFATQCIEVSTASPVSGLGALVTLEKRGPWPKDEVAAFFALAGAWKRNACGGWFEHDGAPARTKDPELDAAWRSLRTMIEDGEFRLGAAEPETMHTTTRLTIERLLGRRDSLSSEDATYDFEVLAADTARGATLLVDGQRAAPATPVRPPIRRPWTRCIVLSDRWNDGWTLGETATEWALVHWSTSA